MQLKAALTGAKILVKAKQDHYETMVSGLMNQIANKTHSIKQQQLELEELKQSH